MKLRQYLDSLPHGGITGLAGKLGISTVYLQQLAAKRDGREPSPTLSLSIERATNGTVTRRDLRPDDCHLIWPDLADSKQNQPAASGHQALEAINSEALQQAQEVA